MPRQHDPGAGTASTPRLAMANWPPSRSTSVATMARPRPPVDPASSMPGPESTISISIESSCSTSLMATVPPMPAALHTLVTRLSITRAMSSRVPSRRRRRSRRRRARRPCGSTRRGWRRCARCPRVPRPRQGGRSASSRELEDHLRALDDVQHRTFTLVSIEGIVRQHAREPHDRGCGTAYVVSEMARECHRWGGVVARRIIECHVVVACPVDVHSTSFPRSRKVCSPRFSCVAESSDLAPPVHLET